MKKLFIIIGCALAVAVLAATQSQWIPGNLTVSGVIADPTGLAWIKEAPMNGVKFVRQNGLWVAAPGGIEEAPINGTPHVRVDGIWAEAQVYLSTVGHNHAGVYEPTFSKGSLVAGTGIGLSGTLASRLVGGGDITVSLGSHSHSASDITSGTLPIARGGTGAGTQADARTALDVPSRAGSGASGTWGISISGDASTLDGIDSTGFATSTHNHSGVYEPVFSKGDLVAGSGTTLTGTLTGRLVGSGNITITATGTGVTDHGALTGLGDDDHTQYHTDARGDARYSQLSHNHSGVYEPVFSKGSLIAGSGITLSGTLSSRLVGSGDVTVTMQSHNHDWSDITGEPSFALAGHTHPEYAPFVFITISEVVDTNEDTTFRSILGTVKSGYSATLAANSLSSGSVLHFEAAGKFQGDDNYQPKLRLKVGSSYYLEFVCNEPYSSGSAPSGTPWNIEAWITVTSAGSSASVLSNGWLVQQTDASTNPSTTAADTALRSRAVASGTLNTTTANVVDLVYAGQDTAITSFSCTHSILRQY